MGGYSTTTKLLQQQQQQQALLIQHAALLKVPLKPCTVLDLSTIIIFDLPGMFCEVVSWRFNRCQDINLLNLQYNTLVCLFAGTNESSTKRLMFQVLFFFMISCRILCKNTFNLFVYFFKKLQK